MRSIFFVFGCLLWQTAGAVESSSELDYYQSMPVVLSASRLSQPLSEAPNAMTVIDRKMIVASGFRKIADLFKLVPGMYVSYYKGSQPIVSYHGATDQYSRRMQVLIDGRSIYLPPINTVDWANLPITIDDIERIEIIRGPAAASYGANSTQGVISIITKYADELNGGSISYSHGNKGINDATVRFGQRGETYDYRMTLAYTADNGYDSLSTNPNNIVGPNLLHNSNDSNQARMLNYRGNLHPDGINSFDFQAGFNHDTQGVGFNDKTPSPLHPASTNGNPFHDLIANSGFVQLGWKHQLENDSKLELHYSHTQENQAESFPVYLNGIYFPGPVVQSMHTGRDQLEVQHTLSTSASNRVIYGGNYQTERIVGKSIIPPLALNLSPTFRTSDYQIFGQDELRISSRLLLNAGGMLERNRLGRHHFSPRMSLNWHATPEQTFRAGISVAYRTPALIETNLQTTSPGALAIPTALPTSPNLQSEKLVSRELGYIGEFSELDTTVDLRVFSDLLSNGIFYDKAFTQSMINGLSAEYRGFEATIKHAFNEESNLIVNFAHETARSNGPTLAAMGYNALPAGYPSVGGTNDIFSASIPRNSASMLFSQRLGNGIAYSFAYYHQDALQPFDRGIIDFQPSQDRVDARIAKAIRVTAGINGEVSMVVQNLFNKTYTEYIASNLFNQRAYLKVTLNW